MLIIQRVRDVDDN